MIRVGNIKFETFGPLALVFLGSNQKDQRPSAPLVRSKKTVTLLIETYLSSAISAEITVLIRLKSNITRYKLRIYAYTIVINSIDQSTKIIEFSEYVHCLNEQR